MYSHARDYRVVSEGVLVGAALLNSWRLCIWPMHAWALVVDV
jgi:hypothetical protein